MKIGLICNQSHCFTPKRHGGGWNPPIGQEIACHFSQDHTMVTKGPAAKKAIRKSPGYSNQILTFESQKWSPVATFESWNN